MSRRLRSVSSDGQLEHPWWYSCSPEQHFLEAPIRAPAVMGSGFQWRLFACLALIIRVNHSRRGHSCESVYAVFSSPISKLYCNADVSCICSAFLDPRLCLTAIDHGRQSPACCDFSDSLAVVL